MFRSQSALGVQFHPEVDTTIAHQWLNRCSDTRLQHAGIVDGGKRLYEEIGQRGAALSRVAAAFFDAWIVNDVLPFRAQRKESQHSS